KSMGAEEALDATDADLPARVKDYLKGTRVDLAIDNIGGDQLPQVIATLGDLGKVSLVGRLAGPVPEFNTATLFFRRIRLGGVAVSTYTNEESYAAWKQVVNTRAKTGARRLVDQVFGFDEVPAAFARLEAGPMGKVVVKVE